MYVRLPQTRLSGLYRIRMCKIIMIFPDCKIFKTILGFAIAGCRINGEGTMQAVYGSAVYIGQRYFEVGAGLPSTRRLTMRQAMSIAVPVISHVMG